MSHETRSVRSLYLYQEKYNALLSMTALMHYIHPYALDNTNFHMLSVCTV